jgi:hypothetical protein
MKGALACSYFDQLIDIGGDERLGSVTPLVSVHNKVYNRQNEMLTYSVS